MNYSEFDKRVLPLVLLAIFLVSVVLALVLRRRSERVRSIPTAIIALAILFNEIVKQRWNLLGEFNAFYLPFHYCSLFLIVIPLAELCGRRMAHVFRPIGACMAFIVTVAMYVSPYGIIGNASETFGTDFYRTSTFIFHHLIVTYLMLVIMLRLCKPRLRDAALVGAIGAVYAGVALKASYHFEANYCNLLESNISFMESFRLSFGQTKYTILMCIVLTVGMTLGALVFIVLCRLIAACIRSIKKSP